MRSTVGVMHLVTRLKIHDIVATALYEGCLYPTIGICNRVASEGRMKKVN